MRRIVFFILAVLTAECSFAQTYTYKPMALDNTCFWVFYYDSFDGNEPCYGYRTAAVIGDTMISGYTYSKIIIYTTAIGTNLHRDFCLNGCMKTRMTFLREDTIARRVYRSDGALFADFNLQLGDTMKGIGGNAIVDSITINNINGIDRRSQWVNGYLKKVRTIEGIGASDNFPFAEFGEFGGYSNFSLRCYSKGGQSLYGSSCGRLPALSVPLVPDASLTRSTFVIQSQQFRVLNDAVLPLNAQIVDMTGRVLSDMVVNSTIPVKLELDPGTYILRLVNRQGQVAYPIAVER